MSSPSMSSPQIPNRMGEMPTKAGIVLNLMLGTHGGLEAKRMYAVQLTEGKTADHVNVGKMERPVHSFQHSHYDVN